MPFVSHYGDLPDMSSRLSITALVFSALVIPIVVFRLLMSFLLHRKLHPDDYFIILSTLCAEALGVLMILCASLGFGKHIRDLSPHVIAQSLKYFMISQATYKLSIAFTKLSILCFYQRLLSIHKKFAFTCKIISVIIGAWTVAVFFATVFQCTPVAYTWKGPIGGMHGSCINLHASWYANAVFNIMTDITIVALPMLVIHKLQMRTREKFELCALFALGLTVCAMSVLRFTTLNATAGRIDQTWQSVNSSTWSVCEANTAIIGSCMPAMKGYVTRALRLRIKDTGDSGSGHDTVLSDITMTNGRGVRTSITGPIRPSLPARVLNLYRDWDSSSDEEAPADVAADRLHGITKTTEIHMVGSTC